MSGEVKGHSESVRTTATGGKVEQDGDNVQTKPAEEWKRSDTMQVVLFLGSIVAVGAFAGYGCSEMGVVSSMRSSLERVLDSHHPTFRNPSKNELLSVN